MFSASCADQERSCCLHVHVNLPNICVGHQASMPPALPCGSAAGASYFTCAADVALSLHRHLLVAAPR